MCVRVRRELNVFVRNTKRTLLRHVRRLVELVEDVWSHVVVLFVVQVSLVRRVTQQTGRCRRGVEKELAVQVGDLGKVVNVH